MDDLVEMLLELIQQLEANLDTLTDEEAAQATNFIKEVAGFIDLEGKQTPSIPQTQAPLSAGSELMWILAGGQEDAFVSYLRTYPDPALNALLQNPEQLRSTIEQLRQKMPAPDVLPVADGIEHAPLNSSNVYGFRYDTKSGKLLVRFNSGSVYGYSGVPEGVFKVFERGAVPAKTKGKNKYGSWWIGKQPSLGAALHALVKLGGYPYTRLR